MAEPAPAGCCRHTRSPELTNRIQFMTVIEGCDSPPGIAHPKARAAARPVGALCGTATIDCNGRIPEATVIPALGWAPGTRLSNGAGRGSRRQLV